MEVEWEEIKEYAATIAAAVQRKDYKPEILVGISVGGLVPTALLSHLLKNKNVLTISAYSYKGKKKKKAFIQFEPRAGALEGKKVLLIDDISHTAETLERVKEVLLERYAAKQVKTASLLVNKKDCESYPDFWAKETIEWINFPWEVAKT